MRVERWRCAAAVLGAGLICGVDCRRRRRRWARGGAAAVRGRGVRGRTEGAGAAAAPTRDAGATVAVEQQRLLCLVALGRPADAEQAMTAIVEADPLYVPDAASAPPRVRAAFQDVRARLVPAIAKAEYERARQAYRSGRLRPAASAGFARVLSIVERSDGPSADPVVRDMAVLAAGFKTLSDKAKVPPPPPAAPAAARAAHAAARGRRRSPHRPASTTATYPGVAVPAHRPSGRAAVAAGPRSAAQPRRGAGDRDQRGRPCRVSTDDARRAPTYDQLLLNAASTWSYVPAQLEGERVKFRKVMKLSFR